MNVSPNIEASIQRLFPNMKTDQALVELLLERAQKNLLRYQSIVNQFESKYKKEFDSFRQEILNSEPPPETEQDYFDWELAVTGIADMETEIRRLRAYRKNE